MLTRKEKAGLAVISIGALLLLYQGWLLFWFLTDDAFITFRYISNDILGYGYVWNPPPFRPVEGYTSFLWVVLLDGIWRLMGVEPPDSANVVSLIFACMTLFLGTLMVLKMNWAACLRRYRVLFLALVLTSVITNRTFLAWTSSGLETAMFNCFFTLWMFCCLFLPAYSEWWLFGIASAAALTYLTRPDGLLIVFVTIGLVALAWYVGWRRSALGLRDIAVVFPLLAIPLHFAWRMSVYGEWLPNTYYAKRIAGRIWLESGIRYFLSFIVEYSLWIWLILLVALIIRAALLLTRAEMHFLDLFSPQNTVLINIAVMLTLLTHVLYYTIAIGGDHFEFRVYSHLIPLLFISFLWMLNAIQINAKLAGLFFILFMVCSWPIPWTHWSITHTLITRKETGFLKASVAEAVQRDLPATPGFLLDYLRWYDSMQFWLIDHAVCMRHQTHKVFYLFLVNVLPSRGSGMALPNDQYPVITEGSVGVLGWVLPTINVIDVLGLNDYVIARNPDVHSGLVAHERTPPPGYVECFAPNVTAQGKDVIINRRTVALTAAKIVQCEHYYAAIVTK